MSLIACPGCDTSISDQAHVCPNCGRPLRGHAPPAPHVTFATPSAPQVAKPKEKKGCGCIGLFLLATAMLGLVVYRNLPRATPKAERLPSQTAAERTRRTALATLKAEGFADREAAARLCEEAGSALTDELRAQCAEAHVAQAQHALTMRDQERARKALEAAIAEGAPAESRRDVEAQMEKILEKMRRDTAETMRRSLGEQLREKLEVDVTVRGIDGDRITLRGDRIDALWVDEFLKGDAAHQLKEAGFQRVELRGAHGFHQNLDWSGMQPPPNQLN